MAVRDPGGCRRHPAPEGLAAELHYISCTLSQQTRQLDEIRCLLKRLANSAGSE